MSGKTWLVVIAAAGVVAGNAYRLNGEAWERGFYTKAQMDKAISLGLTNRADLAEHERRAREREEATKRQGAENAAEMARVAVLACPQDVACWGQKNAAAAAAACGPLIERLAQYQHQWTGPPGERRFATARWRDQLAREVSYVGDRIMFQNGFGAWQHHVYTCDFDTVSGKVLKVDSRPGRLPP